MSNDLISRKALLKKLKDGKNDTREERERNALLRYIVKHEPIAYDVDKVVAKIDKESRKDLGSLQSVCFNSGMHTARRIVLEERKKGGKL